MIETFKWFPGCCMPLLKSCPTNTEAGVGALGHGAILRLLPHSAFARSAEAAGHETPGQVLGLEDGEADLVIGFLFVPAILRPVHPDQEDPVRNRVNGRHIRGRSDSK